MSSINPKQQSEEIAKAFEKENRLAWDKKNQCFVALNRKVARSKGGKEKSNKDYVTDLPELEEKVNEFIQVNLQTGGLTSQETDKIMTAIQKRRDSLKGRFFVKQAIKNLEHIKTTIEKTIKRMSLSYGELQRQSLLTKSAEDQTRNQDFNHNAGILLHLESLEDFKRLKVDPNQTTFGIRDKPSKELDNQALDLIQQTLRQAAGYCISELTKGLNARTKDFRILDGYVKRYLVLRDKFEEIFEKKEAQKFFPKIDTHNLISNLSETLKLTGQRVDALKELLKNDETKKQISIVYAAAYLRALPSILEGKEDETTRALNDFRQKLRDLKSQGFDLGFTFV